MAGFHHLLLLSPAAGQVLCQTPQLRSPAGGGLPLRPQSSQAALGGTDLLRQSVGVLQQLRLAGESLLGLGAILGGQSLLLRHDLLSRRRPLSVVFQAAGQALQLPFQILQILPQGAEQNVVVVLASLQPQHLILGLAALGLRRLQLVLGGGQLPVGSLHGGTAALEPLQLRRPAQYAGAAAGGAAGHGTAPIDDLAVQCHDPEGVAVLPGHGDAAVQVLHDHRAAQKAVEDIPVLLVERHQSRSQTHEAELAFHALLPQLLAADGGQGQECRPAAVPLL